MREVESELWQVFVPATDNRGNQIDVEHHWDREVMKLAGGLTLTGKLLGRWESNDGSVVADTVIPVLVACDREVVGRIIDLTAAHYEQEAVLAFRVSELAIIGFAAEPPGSMRAG